MGRYDTDGSSALAPNDPYKGMDRADYRPNLQVIKGGKSDNFDSDSSFNSQLRVVNGGKARNNEDASKTFRDAEQSALSGNKSFFTGQGRSSGKNKKTGFLKSRKKLAVIGTIVALLTGGGAFLGSTHSLLASALEKLTTEATDTQNASYTKRQARIMRYMLGGELPVENTWQGKGVKKYTKMTGYMKKRLKAQGIEVEGHGKKRVLKFNGETISANDFISKFQNDTKFRDAYMKAKRGRVAGFFDNVAKKIYNKLGISRNLFKNFKQSGDSEADMKSFRDTAKSKFDGDTTDITTDHKEQETKTETDADGNETTTTTEKTVHDTGLDGETNNSSTEANKKAESYVGNMAGRAAKAAKAADGVCALMQVGSMISVAVAANQIYQSINYYMTIMENPSKMMAGDGSSSAVNEVLNTLTTPTTSSYIDSSKIKISQDGESYKIKGEAEEVEVTGAPIEANGLQMMLAKAPAQNTTNTHYSLESTMSSIAKALDMSTGAVLACTGANVVGSVASIVSTVSLAISTAGISLIGQLALDFVVSTTIGIAISTAISFIVPTVAQYLFTNVFETVTGIPAGEMLARGASAANTRIGRSGSGQSPSSEEAVLAYNRVNQEVLAMEAETDRLNRSPFDISSKNTFLGSIAYSLLPLTTRSSTAKSAISNFSTMTRLTSSSIASLTNSAMATGEDSSYMTTFGQKCDQLNSIDAAGDIYCNPITTTDIDLIDMAPDDDQFIDKMSQVLDCNDDGNCTVEDNTDLAKYITYCDGRDSPFGMVDSNILGDLEAGNTVTNSIPIIGELTDLYNATYKVEDLKWATGEACVNSAENSDWETYRYYQRYIEDQRILEQMGAYEDSQNPVTAYQEKYETEHPLDNSPAGYLARISGLTKENAETVLAVLEYTDFIENYDAKSRIAMNGDTTDYKNGEFVAEEIQKNHIHFESSEFIEPETETLIAEQYIIYTDIRNRSHTTA